jgi:hypothetical protein
MGRKPCVVEEDVRTSHKTRLALKSILGKTGQVIDGPKGAATLLGLHPNTLWSRLKKLSIERSYHDCS